MPLRRVSPEDAKALIDQEGYVYVDVRSIPEFEAGHPDGAYNVPIAHLGPAGMTPNPDFLSVMEKSFAKDAKLVVGCKSGGRSLQAASILQSAGFTNLVDQRAGFDGSPGGEPGWSPKGLPTNKTAAAGRGYEALRTKAR
jgi:rhodanese-related sulfurtransferase